MNADIPNDPTDEVLLQRFRDGDQGAFNALVERHHGVVYAIAYARLGDVEAAEDLAQEVFLRAFVQHRSLRDGGRFAPWVCRMARNLAIDWLRRGETRSRLIPMIPMEEEDMARVPDKESPDAHEVAAAREEKALADEALRRLSPAERELVLLHFSEGMSRSDIARQLGVHPSTAGRQLDAAVEKMRGSVEDSLRRSAPALRPRLGTAARTAALVTTFAAMAPQAQSAIVAKAATQGAIAGEHAAAATGILAFLKTQFTLLIGGTAVLGTTKMVAIGTGVAAVIAAGVYISNDTPQTAGANAATSASTRIVAAEFDLRPGEDYSMALEFGVYYRARMDESIFGVSESQLMISSDGVFHAESITARGELQQAQIQLVMNEPVCLLSSTGDPAFVGSLFIIVTQSGAQMRHWMDIRPELTPSIEQARRAFAEGRVNTNAARQRIASEMQRLNIGPGNAEHRRAHYAAVAREYPVQ